MAPCLVAFLCFALSLATLYLSGAGKAISPVWPSNAVMLAAMLLRPPAKWRSILLAGLVGHVAAAVLIRGTILAPLLLGTANLIEAFIAAWAFYAVGVRAIMGSARTVMRFVFVAGLLAPAISSLLGALTAWLLFDMSYGRAYLLWYTSDALGLLIFTPFLHDFFQGKYKAYVPQRRNWASLEPAALMLMCAIVTEGVFLAHRPLVFLIVLPIQLVTFRLGWPGVKLAVMIVAVIGGIHTALHSGPIMMMSSDPMARSHFFQIFLVALLFSSWPVAMSLAARKALVERLQDSEQSLRILAAQSSVLLLTFDVGGTCRKAVGASDLLLDRVAETLPGLGFGMLSLEMESSLRFAHGTAMDKADRRHALEFRSRHDDNLWLEVIFRALDGEDGRCLGTLATIHDVSARKAQALALARSAETDSLTGLLNRAGFLARLHQALAEGQRGGLSLALVDVDRFKLVNDNCGHQVGDAVLKEIALRISGELRAGDAVGRLGGDEFVILLQGMDWQRAQDVCARLVEAVSAQPVLLPSGTRLDTAISCGVARYEPGRTADQFMHDADVALYEAKRGGRNRMVAA